MHMQNGFLRPIAPVTLGATMGASPPSHENSSSCNHYDEGSGAAAGSAGGSAFSYSSSRSMSSKMNLRSFGFREKIPRVAERTKSPPLWSRTVLEVPSGGGADSGRSGGGDWRIVFGRLPRFTVGAPFVFLAESKRGESSIPTYSAALVKNRTAFSRVSPTAP